MSSYLSSNNFPCDSDQSRQSLSDKLAAVLQGDYHGDFFTLFADYQRILADNQRSAEWPTLHDKLQTLFMCGRAAPLDGPMIGIPVCIRDSDFFRKIARQFGSDRSHLASVEVLAAAAATLTLRRATKNTLSGEEYDGLVEKETALRYDADRYCAVGINLLASNGKVTVQNLLDAIDSAIDAINNIRDVGRILNILGYLVTLGVTIASGNVPAIAKQVTALRATIKANRPASG